MGVITLGLSEILVGAAITDGTAPDAGDLTKIGKTYQDSCKMKQNTATVTEHFEEGKAAPEVRNKKKQIPALTFSIMDPDPQMLADYVGGEFVAAAVGPPATPATWGFNGDEVVANRFIRVKSKQGLWVDIPNGDLEATINSEFSEKGIFLVDFSVVPMAVSSGKALKSYVPLA